MESEQENGRGILRLAHAVVMIGDVYCLDRVLAGVQWEMSVYPISRLVEKDLVCELPPRRHFVS